MLISMFFMDSSMGNDNLSTAKRGLGSPDFHHPCLPGLGARRGLGYPFMQDQEIIFIETGQACLAFNATN